MKIVLTYNVKPPCGVGDGTELDDTYAEWDELDTIIAVRDALAVDHEVILLEECAEIEGQLLTAQPDLVFNLAEGLSGPWREARLPALLERHNIPFTGSSSQTLRRCLDKAATKRALLRHGLPTPAFTVIYHVEQVCDAMTFPLMVKPLHEGSSKGIRGDSVVSTPAELRLQVQRILDTYSQPALVEAFLPGREFTVALLGNGVEVRALPLVEICFAALQSRATPIYSYEAKWLWDTPEHPLDIFTCPADIGPELTQCIVEMALQAFQVLACRDWCRIDIRLDAAGHPAILELNPLPGILPQAESHSCFPRAAAAGGVSYPELIREVADLASQRYGLIG